MDLDLAELIRRHQGDRTLHQLSRDCGGVPKPARLHQLIREPQKTFPEPPTLRGLAHGLGVPVRVVLHAAARSVGLALDEAPGTRLATLMPVDSDVIPERTQDAVLTVVRAAIAREREIEQILDVAGGNGDGLMRPMLRERGVEKGAAKTASKRTRRSAASGE